MDLRTILLLLLTLSSALYSVEERYNIFKNPGFESGKTAWSANSGTTLHITNDSHSGSKALSYTTGGIAQSTDALKNIDGKKRYMLTGYYKNKGSVAGMWMGAEYADANWNTLGSSEIALANSYSYTPFAIVFTPPAGTVYITYWSWSDAPGGGKTLLDDLALYPEGVTPDDHSPQLTAPSSQTNHLGESVALQLQASDADHDKLIYTVGGLPEESGIWLDPVTGRFSGIASPKGEHKLTLYALDNRGGIAQQPLEWQIDAAPPTPCNILQNPGFETSLFGWDNYGKVTERTAAPHSGDYALRIRQGGLDQFTQQLTGAPDTYNFNGYYKTEGSIDGAWAGIIFYDKDHKALFSREISLTPSTPYKHFSLSGTSTDKTRYIQAWVWVEGEGKVLLDDLKLGTSACFHYVIPSSLPPGNIPVLKAPQYVVIGFDDNTKAEGIDWAIDLFKNRKNADGTPARVSFYLNTKGLHVWQEDEPAKLLAAMQRLSTSGHEIGNHTYCHHGDIYTNAWDAFTHRIVTLGSDEWQRKIGQALDDITQRIGYPRNKIYGFRAPYLLYNQAMFTSIKEANMTYDCSIEEGYARGFDGSNFRWPYQLDDGSPGHDESWASSPENPDAVTIGGIPGLWELPNHVFMIPKNSDCAKYGIQSGLWHRMKQRLPYLDDHKITGFDYNLWSDAALNKAEVLGILKYNLDLRLQGNRAPFMIGAHTQYYTDAWASQNAPNATVQQMREAIREFVDYALSKTEVRIRPAIDIINWCKKPVALP
ncbi:MAG TPA: hypothetical protein ENK93_04415 [Campylobacteraceae bacterium]|nr:hypothetical protein [Campylobacteraceae bacterium]